MLPGKLICFFLIFSFLVSCENKRSELLFEEPQPQNVKNLKGLPGKLIGTYISLKDSSHLVVSAQRLIRYYEPNIKIHKNELDSSAIFKNGILTDLKTQEKFTAKIEGDSIRVFQQFIDTIFDFSNQDLVRKFKGHYFLNIRYGNREWDVKDLVYRRGKISLRYVSTQEDLDKLRTIVETKEDTNVTYKPTRKQFKEFMKQNGFNDEEQFIRIK